MKRYETRTETITSDHLADVTCDLCGVHQHPTHLGWATENFDVAEVEVKMQLGHSYPGDEFYGARIEYDLCPTCFRDRLMPWLEGQGAKPRLRET